MQVEDLKETPPGIYRAGTLVYTKASLAVLFFWLLWGDFCYTVMEAVTPSLMPLKFKALGASDFELGLISGTIPGIVYMLVNPVVSFRSDRFRSRWGRRIPFIAGSMPFIVIALVALAFSGEITQWVQRMLGPALHGFTAAQISIATLGVLLVGFTFFNTFASSVFWYLFNDVVPEHLLARFMSMFRFISLGAGAIYNYFVFPLAGTHYTGILLGAALLYFVGFSFTCLNVRERKYPPPEPYADGTTGVLGAVKSFGKECHAFPIYWYLWITTFVGSIGGGVSTFGQLLTLSTGLNLEQMGHIGSISLVITALFGLGAGWLSDRFHPIRVVVVGAFLQLVLAIPLGFIWVSWHPHLAPVPGAPPAPEVTYLSSWQQGTPAVFWTTLLLNVLVGAPISALINMWDPPMLMRLFPRTNYGQFCATNAIWRQLGGIFGGGLAGAFLDHIAKHVGHENAYFYIPLWQICFALPAFIVLLGVYWKWKKMGGDESFVPPVLAAPEPAPVAPV